MTPILLYWSICAHFIPRRYLLHKQARWTSKSRSSSSSTPPREDWHVIYHWIHSSLVLARTNHQLTIAVCTYYYTTTSNSNIIITRNGGELSWSDTLRYLGVYITAGHKLLADVNWRSRSLYAIGRASVCRLSSVCVSSVTLVHPTQPVEVFGNFFHHTIAQGL